METRKNLFFVLGEWWESRRTNPPAMPRQPSRLGAVLRWLLPNGGTLLLVALLIATQSLWARSLAAPNAPGPSATTVNYQGRLADNAGVPLDGNYGMSFALYDTATNGALIWGPESHTAVPVSDGLFSVGLGSQTSGGIPTSAWNGDRYLEITVGGETLTPRELIRSVPIAGMALTVPDGAVKSDGLNLEHGTACLSSHVQVSMPGGYQIVTIPGLDLSFSLQNPSLAIVWVDGLAVFDQESSVGEVAALLTVDETDITGAWSNQDGVWFNVKGMRIIDLDSGSHSMSFRANSQYAGTFTAHGALSSYVCINYLILGEQ